MELFASALIPAVLGGLAIRMMIRPIQWTLKAAIHTAGGFLCLWLLNAVQGFTGIYLPINAITAAAAGLGGIPGIWMLAMLELL